MTQNMHILAGVLYTSRVLFTGRAVTSLAPIVRPKHEYTILVEAYRLFFAHFVCLFQALLTL
ncbi:MAG: hypothetical protein H0U76_24800 [Ktedonobacteraceae bacterium]|nr:hypothetical protein [Ktedonobacteraceae bacterium]